MKHLVQHFCLWMTILLPFTTHAILTGEIILRHPTGDFNELHITTIKDPRDSRNIFRQEREIEALSVQKNGDLLVTTMGQQGFITDIFLFDRNTKITRNLTQAKFQIITDLAISVKGDGVFTNLLSWPVETQGLYFISRSEIMKLSPKINLLKLGEINSVDFSPDGKQIAYDNRDGIFTMDIETRRVSQIKEDGHYPTFSPNGKQLAFFNSSVGKVKSISIILLASPIRERRFILKKHLSFIDLKWSTKGRYLIYTVRDSDNQAYSIYSESINGGPHDKILDKLGGDYIIYDWTSTPFPVEPTDLITTTWGHIKAKHNPRP